MAKQSECAEWLDISERRFRELLDEGVIARADKGGYDLKTVVQQYVRNLREIAAGRGGGESQANKAGEDARLARARADKAEMELAEARGLLVPVDQFSDALNAAVQIMRTRVLAIPTKVAPRVGAKDIAAAEGVIRAEVFEALKELSTVQVRSAARN
jgi:phage terminase Nu1 subunit (DNA packaging protein)